MASKVNVSRVFDRILSDTMQYVRREHGDEAAQHLFFELYNHTFGFLERQFGREAVTGYWQSIGDQSLGDLEHLMRTKGFKGMEEYWRATFGQEGADYEMQVGQDFFQTRVKRCPPVQWLKSAGVGCYPQYSEHCRVLYQRVADRCGYEVEYIAPDESTGACCGLRITRKRDS